jgi:eukaryotic-like serine/threonine-protein kinase
MSDQTKRPVLNDRYEIHRRIARGGMAEVYLARDQLLDRPVAVKVLFPEFATDPAFVARFRREAQAAANLNHPNIVAVYDWGKDDSTYYIVMEYVDGRSLADIIRTEGPLHPDRAADIAIDIAAALGFAHRNGVIHRDVKPGNVLVTTQGRLKVADFGIARARGATTDDPLTQAGTVMGTATYFSPEQAQGLPLDPRSDLYSLGVVMYEMVTGKPPFPGDNPVSIAYRHVQDQPEPLRSINPDVPVDFEAIVDQLLAKQPIERYASAEDLRADLRRFREGEPVLAAAATAAVPVAGAAATQAVPTATTALPATKAGAAPPAVKDEEVEYYGPKRKWWMVLVAIVLLAALAGLVYLLFQTVFDDNEEPTAQLVAVPRVIDLTEEQATEELENEGFEVRVDRADNDTVPEGTVFGQDPAPGTRLEEGSTVTIAVSSGATTNVIPQVTGSTAQQAITLLNQACFTNIDQQDAPHDRAPAGTVFEVSPAEGTEVACGAAITLTVSQGQRTIPDVAGQTVAAASSTLGQFGFTAGPTQEEASPSLAAGLVIRTDPPAGTAAASGTEVTLIVSSGPPPVTVPDVTGDPVDQATAELEAANFVVEVQNPCDPDETGTVQNQNPSGGASAAPGSTVRLVLDCQPADGG